MSDARDKFQQALADAKAKREKGGPKPSGPKSAPPARVAPARAAKKTAPSKLRSAPPKKTAKKKAKASRSGILKNIQHFATNMLDELKTATTDIAPGTLLSSANNSLKNIKKAVGLAETAPSPGLSPAAQPDAPPDKQAASQEEVSDSSPADLDPEVDQPEPAEQENNPPEAMSLSDLASETSLPEPKVSDITPVEQPSDADEQAHAPEAPAPSPEAESAEQPQKPAPKPHTSVISKTEHVLRCFRALQTVLANPIWAPIVTDLKTKPSTLYAPRQQFDAHFANPVFRKGLKAATRLADACVLPPKKMRFSAAVIERVTSFNMDPNGKIKTHTELLTSVLDKEMIQKVLSMMKNKHVKHLLFSVSTRLGTFVPTIESLARIYLSMRKKETLNSGDRLKIQAEILLRYQKAHYTEEMAKKARNLATTYFMDYLADNALKVYKERTKDVPDGQDASESQFRRHNVIKTVCTDLIDEWSAPMALPTQAVNTIKTKFQEAADQYVQESLGDSPSGV